MRAQDIEDRLFSMAGNNLVGTAYSILPLIVIRAMLLGGFQNSPNANFAWGCLVGAVAFWNIGLWMAWLYVRLTIQKEGE